MIIKIAPLLVVALVAALIYYYAPPKPSELAKLVFFAAVLWMLHELAGGRL